MLPLLPLISAAGAEEIRARGYAPLGPTDFERPVTMPDGSAAAAKFRIFQWPIEEAPAGVRIFACQHKTRDAVWIPELMKHANGAQRLRKLLLVSPEPVKDAAHLGSLIDQPAKVPQTDGAISVPSGSDRADFIFITKDDLARRYPGVSLTGLPERGGAGLVLATSNLNAAESAAGNVAIRSGSAVCVSPHDANGTLLVFVSA